MTTSGRKTLDRALSRLGLCSRTEARRRVAAGEIQVNGRTVRDPDTWIDPVRDRITIAGAPLRAAGKQVWMLHKPVGYVTTAADEHERATVYDLLPAAATWLGPVGRLDRDSSGLLLFTNDSDLAHAVTAPASKLPKVYEVLCRGRLGADAVAALAGGVELHDGPTLPAQVEPLGGDDRTTRLRIVLVEGRNRQVRRMVRAVGSIVHALHRVAIGPIRLGDLPSGEARRLTDDEVRTLRAAVRPRPGPPPTQTSRGRVPPRSRARGDRP